MPFEYLGVPEGTKFTHKESAKTFVICNRFRQDNKLTFYLSEEGNAKVVGYVVVLRVDIKDYALNNKAFRAVYNQKQIDSAYHCLQIRLNDAVFLLVLPPVALYFQEPLLNVYPKCGR